jgi:hypothetical protein
MTDAKKEEKSVRVAVALARAVALSDELQATVLELADTLRHSGITVDCDESPAEEVGE